MKHRKEVFVNMDKSTYSLIETYMISCMEDSAHDKEHIYRVLYNAALLIVIVGVSLGILVSFSSPMCYRYLYMAYIPIVLLVSLLFKEKLVSTKQLYVILILGSLSAWYRIFYVVYNANIMS